MVRARDQFWQYGEDLKGRFKCTFCTNSYSGGIARLKSHLSGVAGRDIVACTLVPDEVQAAAIMAIGGSEGSNKRSRGSSSTVGSTASSQGQSLTQSSLPAIYNKKDKEIVDKAFAKAFFMNNIAFNVIQNDSFVDAVTKAANYGAGYTLPSYSTLRTKWVDDCKEEVEGYVEVVKSSWAITGCTLMSDMWSDIKERSVINVIAYCPKGAVFLKSFEKSAVRHTGLFLADLFSSVIDEIGPENVVQVISDNASNYENAGGLLMLRYPHIYKTRCAAHGINLLLKDIYKEIEWIRNVFDDAKKIVDFMYRHTILLSLMRDHTVKELKNPNKTRFVTNFLMLQSVLEVEEGLRQMVASTAYRGMNFSTSPIGRKVTELIQSNIFWSDGRDIISCMEPLVIVLRLVDGECSTAGYLFEAMERARRTLQANCLLDSNKYSKMYELFESRKVSNVLHKVHAATTYLNPSLMYDGLVKYEQPEVKSGLLYVAETMITEEERTLFAHSC